MLNRLETIEKNKVKLEIEVASPDVDTALAKAYRKVVRQVNLPGFRKGKVPRRILESRFGPEILHEEALELLVPPAYEEVLNETDISPIGQPDFELIQIEEGKPLLFNAVVEVLPPVELGEYKGVEVEQEEASVDEIQVDQHLFMLREQNARLIPKEEGEAEEGDLLTIDFKGFIDGEPFEGGEAEGYSLELGSKIFIPGFEEQLVGASPEEEREVKVTFPDKYSKEELAGKEAFFKVTVKQIKKKHLPELDDEFAKEVSDFDTLEEMKDDLREKLLNNAREESKARMEEALIGKIAEKAEVDLPQTLVERQLDRLIGEFENYLRYQGMAMDQFLELAGKKIEELREERREEAERRTRINLVLDAIAKKEGIDVEDSELDDKIASIAESYNDSTDRVREIIEKQGRLPVIREEMRIRKVIDLLVSEAKIEMVKKEKEKKEPQADQGDSSAEEKQGGSEPAPKKNTGAEVKAEIAEKEENE
ncbi:MAG TPA: trigger factor [Firmicutes bacterium]|nr:trigger factor [Bacillota bacterium]